MGGNADVVVVGAVPARPPCEKNPMVRLGRGLYQCLGKHVTAPEMKSSLAELL
jgi:hypothetical protein